MKKADQFIFPTAFTGEYPNGFAGYTFLQWTQQGAFHPVIDWNFGAGEADYGKPVQCIANGQIIHQSRETKIGYGIIVVVKHELSDQLYIFIKDKYHIDAKNIYSFYAHLKDEIVSDGQDLNIGDLVGYVGKSGTTVSHLHQELYKAVPGTSWRYWPTLAQGWTQEKLKQYYIDTYDLIINQPQSTQPTSTLEQCQTDLEQERKWKNDTYSELQEVKNDLDGVKKQQEFLDNVIKQYANMLGITADTALIAGEIQKFINIQDELRQKDKKIDELETAVRDCNRLFDEKEEMYQESVRQHQADLKVLHGLEEKYKGLEGIYNKLHNAYEDLKEDQKFNYKHLIFGFYIREKI